MDVVRYADTAGDNADYPIPEAARYRDYIIDSFNADKPFDRFVREQLAGDLLARQGPAREATPSSRRHGLSGPLAPLCHGAFELWHLTLEDTIDTTGRAFLGLTLRCARCHDHKFDPVTQRDYYALYGIFASTRFPYAGSEEFVSKKFPRPGSSPWSPEDRAAVESNLLPGVSKSSIARSRSTARLFPAGRAPERERATEAIRHPADLPVPTPSPKGSRRHRDPACGATRTGRGRWCHEGSRADFPGGIPTSSLPANVSGRLQLADWLTRADHPLTARVMANRIWQHHFGTGIVATPSNFGVRGDEPSHPELLDWLAARLVSSKWSIKDLHREILLSHAYQLSSGSDDHDTRRRPRRSLALAVPAQEAGRRVDPRRDARGIGPARPATAPAASVPAHRELGLDSAQRLQGGLPERRPQRLPDDPAADQAPVPGDLRRARHEYLDRFPPPIDGAASGPLPHEQPLRAGAGPAFARRLIAESTDRDRRLVRAWELAWGRLPTSFEHEQTNRYLERYAKELHTVGTSAERIEVDVEVEVWASLARILLTSNEFFYVE